MNRSRSRSRLIETAFVSRTRSSTEDLDEADRIANHPVLRSSPVERWGRPLRKSRSEMGGSPGKGLAVWQSASAHGSPYSAYTPPPRATPPKSYTPPASKSGLGLIMRLARSSTITANLSSAKSSSSPGSEVRRGNPPTSGPPSPSTTPPIHRMAPMTPDTPDTPPSHHVVSAVIEQRECKTPPPPPKVSTPTATPPNTAPLPTKFSRVPHNLLRHQLDSSSSNSDASPPPPFNLSLALRRRLKLDVKEDSSSAESTPQQTQKFVRPTVAVKRGSVDSKPPNPVLELARRNAAARSKFFSSGESSCSSAMSSLESVRSTASDGVQSLLSSESGAVSSMSSQSSAEPRPTLELRHARPTAKTFQVLSPISDKSQEQCSEVGDQKTPKSSPTADLDNNISAAEATSTNDALNNNNDDLQQALDVPWEVPKLQRRLHQSNNMFNLAQKRNLRGSDSGISMSSQDVQEIKELLNVPWDMPKLRKRTLQLQPASRPHSMPSAAMTSSTAEPWASTASQPDNICFTHNLNLNLGAVPSPIVANPEDKEDEWNEIPPPPPGFEDEFYLTETQPLTEHTKEGNPKPKHRPKMTLSFNIDLSQKTLMFATNSPFSLIDCEEIDPNLSLDRQDWYHGAITRKEAERILRPHSEGSYLVRNVEPSRQEFALSLKSARGYMHMRIKRDPQNRDFQLSDFPRRFMTIPQMVHHYTRNRLPIKGAEHMCLKRPVKEDLL